MSAHQQPERVLGGVQPLATIPGDVTDVVGTTSSTQLKTSLSPSALPEQGNRGYLEAAFVNTPNAIIAVDEHLCIFDINPAAATILGVSHEQVIGRQCTGLLRCRNLNGTVLCGTTSCPHTRVVQQKQQIAQEELIMGLLPDQPREFTTTVIPIDRQQGTGVVFVARDMSAMKVANHVRANFVSMVSHELRTPLNSVHGFIDLLLQGQMGELNEEQHTYLGYTQEGVQQLVSIVEDILFMTRSDSGQFEMKQQEVDLRVLVKQIIDSLQPQALKAEVVLDKDIPAPSPILYVDPQRMKQVLNNLVTNAIKFTPPGGTVTVRARPYNERFLMISVSDTGYGIPVEDRQHVFERFYQSNHAQQSKLGGYGLGLPIAKLIVEQHGGEISFESVIDKGTTFNFTAPLSSDLLFP
jgi:signal transduction histidine kinase